MCKHLNCTIYEFNDEVGSWSVQNGVVDDEAYFSAGNIQNVVRVKCTDCKMDKFYNRRAKAVPKWLRTYLDKIEKRDDQSFL